MSLRILLLTALTACAPSTGPAGGPSSGTPGAGVPSGTPTGAPTGSPTTGPTTTSLPLVVLQGHIGRTAVSCDGGLTWVADHSNDDATRCWGPTGPDCDHRYDSARGIAYGEGWFVTAFGWGEPGGLYRSRDGVDWEETEAGTWAAGVAYGNGVFVAGDQAPYRSTDGGATWTRLPYTVDRNVRRTAFVPAGGGRFFLANDGPLMVSSDGGQTWDTPPQPPGCGTDMMFSGGIVEGNGVIVAQSGPGGSCVSSDAGASFTAGGDLGLWLTSRLLFDGSRFAVWSYGERHSSVDGLTWITEPITPALNIEGVLQIGDGSFVGVGGSYEDQEFYRSADGLDWEVITGFGGHPVFDLAFGNGEPSAACP